MYCNGISTSNGVHRSRSAAGLTAAYRTIALLALTIAVLGCAAARAAERPLVMGPNAGVSAGHRTLGERTAMPPRHRRNRLHDDLGEGLWIGVPARSASSASAPIPL